MSCIKVVLTASSVGSFTKPDSKYSRTPTNSYSPRTKSVNVTVSCAVLAHLVSPIPYRSILDDLSSGVPHTFHLLSSKVTCVVDRSPDAMHRVLSNLCVMELGANDQYLGCQNRDARLMLGHFWRSLSCTLYKCFDAWAGGDRDRKYSALQSGKPPDTCL